MAKNMKVNGKLDRDFKAVLKTLEQDDSGYFTWLRFCAEKLDVIEVLSLIEQFDSRKSPTEKISQKEWLFIRKRIAVAMGVLYFGSQYCDKLNFAFLFLYFHGSHLDKNNYRGAA